MSSEMCGREDAPFEPFSDIHRCVRGPAQMEDGQETRQRMVNDKLSVSELASTALTALPPIVALPALTETLRGSRYQTFPISPDTDAALCSGARAGSCICAEKLARLQEPALVLSQLAEKDSCRARPARLVS